MNPPEIATTRKRRSHRNPVAALCLACMLLACEMVHGATPAIPAPPAADLFAEIAAQQSDYRDRRLEPVEPEKLPERFLPLDAAPASGGFRPAEKITTAEQLRAELEAQRKRHEPFLQDLAPALPSPTIQQRLESFDWRVETEDDRADSGGALAGRGKWERVRIPHYGGPMGRVATLYRTEFEVTPSMQALGALFVCFKGVDYEAQVFVNGSFLGSHEGMFAPFEFELTQLARPGKNVLLVKVLNDFTMLGNNEKLGHLGYPEAIRYQGDKVCASVTPGWDEPGVGWHCCPPGMGIWQDVAIEARRRVNVHDVFVRPLLPEQGKAEAWVEVFACDYPPQKIGLALSVHGQNFAAAPVVVPDAEVASRLLPVVQGVNVFKIPLTIPQPRLWSPETPWLYQLQVKLLDEKGQVLDTAKRQFGLRTFRMETVAEPKGRMFLNGQGVKLRGTNHMGGFQQCVIRKDWRQLIDDILLVKITNMNYIRLTHTPVQPEIYDYCDRLGMMVQSDLPLFARVSRNQFCECVRQAEEMERLVRSHPSNVMVTYINEPFANGWGAPHRNLTRPELTQMFQAADSVVRMANPDRVSKPVDGDYDPPGPGLPDEHCYTLWYNGHGVEWGRLHKGFWMRTKPGWVFGCGEYGIEALDFVDLMRRRYPKEWLPQTAEEEKTWSPTGEKIPGAQTGKMHASFYETPRTLNEWIERSQTHQAWGIRAMTEAFRRQNRQHTCVIHLLIDAFPAGWMKAVMDCERRPKAAWFTCRDALTPLAVQWRSDRRAFLTGEPMKLEAWLCNDLHNAPAGATLRYQLELDGKPVQSGATPAQTPKFAAAFQGFAPFKAPDVTQRAAVTARIGLVDPQGQTLHDATLGFDIFPRPAEGKPCRVRVVGDPKGKAAQLARDLGCEPVFTGPVQDSDAVLIDELKAFRQVEAEIAGAVTRGARAVFLELPAGEHAIAQTQVTVSRPPNGPLHFASRATGHPLVDGFQGEDFRLWYDASVDRISPLLTNTVAAPGWVPVLASFDKLAAACKPDGQGWWCLCQIALAGRTAGNPVAEIFARRLLGGR
jgi:hypothetical protein